MPKNKVKNEKRYFIEYTHSDLDFTISYHVVSFTSYRKFVNTLRLILDCQFCSITSVYKDTCVCFSK